MTSGMSADAVNGADSEFLSLLPTCAPSKHAASIAPPRRGSRFGRLTVLAEAEPYRWRGRISRRQWFCECVCGRASIIRDDVLRSGHGRSCGCLRVEVSRERLTLHGARSNDSRTSEYNAWQSILRNRDGVAVCKRWRTPRGKGFRNFLLDLGRRPSEQHHVVRLHQGRMFSPTNCVWANRTTRRGSPRHIVTLGSEMLSRRELADRYNVSYELLCKRLQRGWPLEQALKPVQRYAAKAG